MKGKGAVAASVIPLLPSHTKGEAKVEGKGDRREDGLWGRERGVGRQRGDSRKGS